MRACREAKDFAMESENMVGPKQKRQTNMPPDDRDAPEVALSLPSRHVVSDFIELLCKYGRIGSG